MTTTYEISKGHQYDRDGALVQHGCLYARYSVGQRRDGTIGLTIDGHMPAIEDKPAVAEAVTRVMESGQAETLTLGLPEVTTESASRPAVEPCPRCKTWCYGDCSY